MPGRPRVVDQGEHARSGEPGMRLAMVEVGDVGRPLAAPPDLDRLAERIQEPIAQRVADVGVVEAAVPRRLGGQRGQLVGRGVGARRVVEAR